MLDRIIHFSLKNKFAVWLLTIIVMAAGLYSGMTMKLETIPNINTPVISVVTAYPGATPEEVANKVTIPIEKAVKNLNGVDIVTSSSFQNASSVQITYDYEKDMDEAKKELEEALTLIQFPEGVDKPKISKISFNSIPVMALSISDKKASLADLTKMVEDEIVPSLERINGVSSVQISGQQIEEVQIALDDKKLAQLGLNKETVQNVIKGSDVSFPLGLYTFNDKEQSVVVDGNITTLEELKNLEIPVIPQASNPNNGMNANVGGTDLQGGQPAPGTSHSAITPNHNAGNPTIARNNQANGLSQQAQGLPTVKLGEIADIQVVKEAESISRTNGKEAIGLQIVKAADANTVTVVNEIKKELDKFADKIDGLQIITSFDMATP
ncbi:efflux RND transporter permease subunit, partial [Parageobacillus thermoglucosidasius]